MAKHFEVVTSASKFENVGSLKEKLVAHWGGQSVNMLIFKSISTKECSS